MAKSIKHPYQPSANMGCDTEFYLSKKKNSPIPYQSLCSTKHVAILIQSFYIHIKLLKFGP